MSFTLTNIVIPENLSAGDIGTLSATISNDFFDATEVIMVSPFASMTVNAQSVIVGSDEPLLNFGTSWGGSWASASTYPVPAGQTGSFLFGFDIASSPLVGQGTAILGFSLQSSSSPILVAANFNIVP